MMTGLKIIDTSQGMKFDAPMHGKFLVRQTIVHADGTVDNAEWIETLPVEWPTAGRGYSRQITAGDQGTSADQKSDVPSDAESDGR